MIVGFIGAGKMARALASGLVRGGVITAGRLICSSRTEKSGGPFLNLLPGAKWTSDNEALVTESDLVILAIKPQVFSEVLPTLREGSAGKLFLSLAAGVTLEKIAGWLHSTARVVRAMPNTPMQIGAGASAYAGGAMVTEADYDLVQGILSAAGKAWRVEEEQMDAITALSGSGPAYVFHFIDALTKGGVALGLPEKLAYDLALQTVLGSAELAAGSKLAPLELAAQVKSPRGTTLAGCAVLEEHDALEKLMAKCLAAAKTRAEELAGEKN
ncbi:MAG: pyrroline-5-carboxylate reductase [Methylacidiphilales bacterium]|nr:pyrroline-5-carboxylate reductase [Candidatus Methylacidiphilales bacterium]